MATAAAKKDETQIRRYEVTDISPPGRILDLNLREFWRYRQILYFFVWRDLKVRYKQTVVGAAWALIQPVAIMILFTVFFGQLLGLPTGNLPDPVFYFSTLLPWIYFAGALTNATNTLVDNQNIIRKIYFPRLLLPVAAVIPGLIDLAIALIVLLGLMIYYAIVPTLYLLLLPVFLLLAVATALGAGLWLAVLNATYRDVRYAVPFLLQLWFFLCPVIVPAEAIVSRIPPQYRWIYGLNPMVATIEGFRWSITGQGELPGQVTYVSIAMVCFMLLGGLVYFRRKEITIADVV